MSRTIFTFLVFSISLLAQVTSIPGATGGGSSATASGYSAAVSAQTTLTVTAATHGQGTSPVAGCFDNSTPAVSVSCSYTRNTSGDVVFTWAPAFTGTVNIWAGAGTSGISGGGNLTTVGAIPYVSASGVLNQDATNFFWDATNHRLGVGTASPSALLHVAGANIPNRGQLSLEGTGISQLTFYDSTTLKSQIYHQTSDESLQFRNAVTGYMAFFTNTGAGVVERFRLAPSTANLLLGTTTDGNYKLDVANSGSSGTLRVYDQTAVTGTTKAVVRAGAGQSGNLQEWQNSAGSALAYVTSSGQVAGSDFYNINGLYFQNANVIDVAQNFQIRFSSTSTYGGSKDLGLARNAAGVLEINSGTAGQYRDLILRRSQHSGVTVSALPAAAAGNAGSIQYVTDANATTIGSTVAGGGSNKVMVWSDGTNWKIYAN